MAAVNLDDDIKQTQCLKEFVHSYDCSFRRHFVFSNDRFYPSKFNMVMKYTKNNCHYCDNCN